MMFLVSSRHEGSVLAGLPQEHLEDIRKGIQDAFDAGAIQASYAIVGGGSVWVIEAETEAVVSRLLRTLGIKTAEVTPVVRTLDLLDAYIEQRRNASVAIPATATRDGTTA
jgi:hypothetical protein